MDDTKSNDLKLSVAAKAISIARRQIFHRQLTAIHLIYIIAIFAQQYVVTRNSKRISARLSPAKQGDMRVSRLRLRLHADRNHFLSAQRKSCKATQKIRCAGDANSYKPPTMR
jgi:hypothetical protein